MHGLVLIDQQSSKIGNTAFEEIGINKCCEPFSWVKPNIYEKSYKFLLPGDFIA